MGQEVTDRVDAALFQVLVYVGIEEQTKDNQYSCLVLCVSPNANPLPAELEGQSVWGGQSLCAEWDQQSLQPLRQSVQ